MDLTVGPINGADPYVFLGTVPNNLLVLERADFLNVEPNPVATVICRQIEDLFPLLVGRVTFKLIESHQKLFNMSILWLDKSSLDRRSL